MRHGDCADLIEDVPDDSIDLLLTDVPYWHMDELEQTRNERATRESKLGSFDDGSSEAEDGGCDDGELEDESARTQTKAEWLAEMAEKFDRFADAVAPAAIWSSSSATCTASSPTSSSRRIWRERSSRRHR